MTAPLDLPPFPVDDALVEEAANRLDIAGRIEGHNGMLLLDVSAPKGEADPTLAFLAQAAVGLHRQIQDDNDLSDIEETLEDSLRADDQPGIGEGCDIYRALLASRLKAILRRPDGDDRLIELRKAGLRRVPA
jgi:hypothetical protein